MPRIRLRFFLRVQVCQVLDRVRVMLLVGVRVRGRMEVA